MMLYGPLPILINFLQTCSLPTMSNQLVGASDNASTTIANGDKGLPLSDVNNSVPLTKKLSPKQDQANSNSTAEPMDSKPGQSSNGEFVGPEELTYIEDVEGHVTGLLDALDSKDWLVACDGLHTVRRLAMFHKDAMFEILGNVVTLVVKAMKNPRSVLSKNAIMTSSDLFKEYQDQVIDFLDPLLLQLLLKASQDKRFVCEAAEHALTVMTSWISPMLVIEKLQSYVKHRNPRIRAKASTCIFKCVNRLGDDGIEEYGFESLIQTAASLFNDQLPEAREGARMLFMVLKSAYGNKFPTEQAQPESEGTEQAQTKSDSTNNVEQEQPESDCTEQAQHKLDSTNNVKQAQPESHSTDTVEQAQSESDCTKRADPWEHFCTSKLSSVTAQAVLKLTSSTS